MQLARPAALQVCTFSRLSVDVETCTHGKIECRRYREGNCAGNDLVDSLMDLHQQQHPQQQQLRNLCQKTPL